MEYFSRTNNSKPPGIESPKLHLFKHFLGRCVS